MKRILALNFFPAFTPVSNGGESKLYNFYKALSKYHHVTLLTSTYPSVNEEKIYHTATFVERRIPKDSYFYKVWGEISEQVSESKGDLSAPVISDTGKYPTLLHSAYLEEYAMADMIFHDFPFTVNYDTFIGLDDKPRVYNSHNCETKLYASLHEGTKTKNIVDIVERDEKKLLNLSDLILYCSETDRDAFEDLAYSRDLPFFYSPNGMIAHQSKVSKETKKKSKSVIFVGSSHLPNITAALHIAQKIAPKCPAVHFDIIGNCLPDGVYPKNVTRHGRVSDEKKVSLFEEAFLALNPMEDGSGSNIKVLDYFSHGVPILSTKFGMRGINAQNKKHFIEADLNSFEEVISSYSDESHQNILRDIGLAGKHFANEHFTWDVIVNNLLPELNVLFERKKENNYTLVLNDYNSFSGVGGGGTRTRGLYEAVNSISDVVFLCFSDDNTFTTSKYNERTTVICIPKTQDHTDEINTTNSLFHISCDDIIASRHCTKNPLLDTIYNILKQKARFIVVEHCYMTPLPIKYNDRFIHSSQNNEANLKKSLLEWHPQKESLLADVEKVESKAVEIAGANIAVSDEDGYSLLEGRKMAGPMSVIRNGSQVPVPVSEATVRTVSSKIKPLSAVFLGSAHMPNVDAVNYLITEIVPHCPNIQFNIVGSVCNSISAKLPKNILLWGIVDEETKCAILQQSLFAINPVDTGSGSNVKLADFFANGLFVVTTKFGSRGYPDTIMKHIAFAEQNEFPQVINSIVTEEKLFTDAMRNERKEIFLSELSMVGIADKFVDLLVNYEKPKKRVLFVTYRYTYPEMGGAEVNLKRFIEALGKSNEFEIDIVASEVSKINNISRFADQYSFDYSIGAPIEMNNVRFARFPVDNSFGTIRKTNLEFAWRTQAAFEKSVFESIEEPQPNGFAWGWSHPEGEGKNVYRWAYTSSSFNVDKHSDIVIKGAVARETLITVQSNKGIVYRSNVVNNSFTLELSVDAGAFEIIASNDFYLDNDPRPLGFILHEIKLNNEVFDISSVSLSDTKSLEPNKVFEILDHASEQTRVPLAVNLTNIRGPHSPLLEGYIQSNAEKYDLIITHNIVFKPAIVAIAAAKQANVPSIIIPHSHLDDDYYHFPDVLKAAQEATRILTVPKAASDFYARKGCNSDYLPGGVDLDEKFSTSDVAEFKKIYTDPHPFVLVLGRKSGAKGYAEVISSVRELNKQGKKLRVVLIGPDDDGVDINGDSVTYLGRQPRSVVRGALMSCLALVNMSVSESFGIVLLEAWLAGKPVIANKMCVAFNDMAIHNENALMVNSSNLIDAIKLLCEDEVFAKKLADNGAITAQKFGWKVVEDKFVEICLNTVL